MLLGTSRPNVLRDVKLLENPTINHLCIEVEEEPGQTVLQVLPDEELVRPTHGQEVPVCGRGRNFDNRAGVAQITEIKDGDDPEMVEAPQNPEQDF